MPIAPFPVEWALPTGARYDWALLSPDLFRMEVGVTPFSDGIIPFIGVPVYLLAVFAFWVRVDARLKPTHRAPPASGIGRGSFLEGVHAKPQEG